MIYDRSIDGKIYNQSNLLEVDALIIGDVNMVEERDIIIQTNVQEP